MFMTGWLQTLAQKYRVLLYACFIDLTQAYDFVDQILNSPASAFCRERKIFVVRQFHDGMLEYVWFDDGEYLGWFLGEHGLRQLCVLDGPPVKNIHHGGDTGG